MADALAALLVFSYAVTLLSGGSVTYFAYRAYRRTDAREFGVLCLGLGLLTVGLVAHAGPGGPAAGGSTRSVVLAVLSAAGLGLVLYSLYAGRERTEVEETS